jgi:hypothetical protein
MMKREVIARQELADRILRSEIDTVIMAFVDRCIVVTQNRNHYV